MNINNNNNAVRFILVALGLLAEFGFAATPPAPDDGSSQKPAYAAHMQALTEKVQKNGTVRVIVRMKVPTHPAGMLSAEGVRGQQTAIAQSQNRVLNGMIAAHPKSVKRFKHIPYLAMEVDADTLAQLKSSPDVAGVTEDLMLRANLTESVPLVGGSNAWAKGYSGAGQTVAILDTGVDKTHPFLAGKVVAEACYSTNEFGTFFTSACPNKQQSQVGLGAGVNCSAEDCKHGTHVAGIAAGKKGVAKDAKIISVQVFTLATSWAYCGLITPCTTAFESDIAKGMEYVYSQRNKFKIASVNLSLGDDFWYTGICDGDPTIEPIRLAAEHLKSAGIATVVASGNFSRKAGLPRPACLSNVVSVGATTKNDFVAYFSNSGPQLKLLAPGVDIVSSVPGGIFDSFNGTSMAAPHVAGAWAVLKSKNPNASVDTVLAALTRTGTPITDYYNGLVRPRIRIDAALDALSGSTPPGPPPPPGPLTQVAPSGNINTTTPTYRWGMLPNTSWYLVWLYDQNGNMVYVRYASPTDAGCTKANSICTLKPTTAMVRGQTYSWQVSAVAGIKIYDSAKVMFKITG
ncbi:MAG: S8 family serine peptidase [Methyloglobulus sp.]|nr:S8 family serine peptidase [Methyloglobulus sp.]